MEQIRLRTLLKEDELYRKWFLKEPKIRVLHSTPPWRLFVQRDRGGRWARVDLPAYTKALGAVKLKLPDVWDMAIHCKPQAFNPPQVKLKGKKVYLPMPPGHRWCVYCRRPTRFLYFEHHPNMKHVNPEEKRCLICGARALGMPEFDSPLSWPVTLGQ